MASRTVLRSTSLLPAGLGINETLPPRETSANALSVGPSSCKLSVSEGCASNFVPCKGCKGFARNRSSLVVQAALFGSAKPNRKNRLGRKSRQHHVTSLVRTTGQNADTIRHMLAGEGNQNHLQRSSLVWKHQGRRSLLGTSLVSVSQAAPSEGLTPLIETPLRPAAVKELVTPSGTESPSGNPTNLVPNPASKETKPEQTESSSLSDEARAAGLAIPSEAELVEFVRDFLDGSVGRRSVLPKVITAARAAGMYVGRGEMPAVLKKHPESFEYNPANQFVELRRPGRSTDKGSKALSFAEREDRFVDFLLALLQERAMPPDGLFFCWVVELANHPASGVNLTGLPRPTRMVSRHLDLFDIDGYGTAMVRVKLTEQGRLRTPAKLPREFRLYLRSDDAQRYRDGVWIGAVDRKVELEERAKALTEEELAVVLFLVRAVHAKGPGALYRFLHLGQLIREAGLTVRGKSPKLVNIAMKSREVFDVHELGTSHVAVSLTQEGWDAAEKLPLLEVPSTLEKPSPRNDESGKEVAGLMVEGTGPRDARHQPMLCTGEGG